MCWWACAILIFHPCNMRACACGRATENIAHVINSVEGPQAEAAFATAFPLVMTGMEVCLC